MPRHRIVSTNPYLEIAVNYIHATCNCRSIADFSDQCSPKIVDEWRSIRESKEFVGTSRPRFSCLIKFPYGLDSSATEMGNDDLQKTMFVAAGDPGNPQLSGLEVPYPNQVGKDC